MSFLKYKIKNEYRSLKDNVIQDFYIPVLKESVTYKRAVGFFSSSALVEISKGISYLARNNGKIQIVASPYLSDEDIEAIQKGYAERDQVINNALIRQLSDEHIDYYSMERLNLLANLIANGVLDIRIAYVENESGIGMYHEKMGIMVDSEGNRIAFSGSMNESKTAMSFNYETIDVFCDWDDVKERERVDEKEKAFYSIWNNFELKMQVKKFPDLTEAIIKKYRIKEADYQIDDRQFPESTIKKNNKTSQVIGARIPEDIVLYDYQEQAISSWVSDNYRGIFDMATGTGKTLTALGAISKISEDLHDYLSVIIVCPYQHLVDQWVDDIVRFNINPIIGYSSSPQKDWKIRLSKAVRDQKIRQDKAFFCFVCTNATFSSDYVQKEINKITAPKLLVVDEAHNFGEKTLASLLNESYDYRLALSATIDRFRDEEGTNLLYSFFGKKSIEYSLDRAIAEGKLTPYKYYPVMVYLNEEELTKYEEISYELAKHLIKGKNGRVKLDAYGEILAIERSRIVAAAIQKISKLVEMIKPYENEHNILVYCGATSLANFEKDKSETNEEDIRQIELVTRVLGNSLNMKVARFTSEESSEERGQIKQHFQSGDDLQAIIAIKCLDEGVNIPGIRTAFILASSTNPKEYIQRRGRVLRKAKGKQFAEIYDFVTLPRPLDEVAGLTEEQAKRDLSLVKNELRRIQEFGRISMNSMVSNELIWEICDTYHIPYDFKVDEEEGDKE